MSLISAVQGVREEIAVRLSEAETDNTDQYTNWINMAFRDIEASFPDAPFLQTSADRTLSAGTRIYTSLLPTNFNKMNNLTNPATNVKLSYVSPEQFDIIRPSATEQGSPTLYTIRGSQQGGSIEFFPVPGTAYTIHLDYQQQMDTVSAGSATVSAIFNLPNKYLDLPILYAESRGLRRRGKYVESQQVSQEYETLKEKMKQDLYFRTTESTRIISGREFARTNRAYDDPIKNMFWGDRTFV